MCIRDRLSDACVLLAKYCVDGIEPNSEKIKQNLESSLMLVTALSPHIGYDKAAKVAKYAHERGITLRQACEQLGFLKAEDFDRFVQPEKMIQPGE